MNTMRPILVSSVLAALAFASATAEAATPPAELPAARTPPATVDELQKRNESAQQLSWAGRYDEALALYAQSLAEDPTNRFALLERAKVLSWAGRHPESVRAFEQLLQLEPALLDARLGLAGAQAASGELLAARKAYQSILADHPGNAAAMLGLAQSYAWSGDLAEARKRYQDMLSAGVGTREAEIGIAYLDLWQGDVRSANASARRLKAAHPDDRLRATRASAAPFVSVSWDQMDDTDSNLFSGYHLEAGTKLPYGVGLRLNYADYDVYTAGQRGSIRSTQVIADFSPRARHQVEVMAGLDQLEGPTTGSYNVTDWGLAYRFPAGKTWGGWVSARREPYRYSVPLIENRIVVDAFSAGASGRVGDDWFVFAEATAWDTSDDNTRLSANLAANRSWESGAHTFQAGAVTRWLDWRKDTNGGYFDPSNFVSLGGTLHAFGPASADKKVDYDVNLEVGLQSFDFMGAHTSQDPYYLLSARVGWQVTAAARLECFAEGGSYASQGSDNWRYTRFGARLVWRFGQNSG